jgi:hypothetical protein
MSEDPALDGNRSILSGNDVQQNKRKWPAVEVPTAQFLKKIHEFSFRQKLPAELGDFKASDLHS